MAINLMSHDTTNKLVEAFEKERPRLLARIKKTARKRLLLKVHHPCLKFRQADGAYRTYEAARIDYSQIATRGVRIEAGWVAITEDDVTAPDFPPNFGLSILASIDIDDFNAKVRAEHKGTPDEDLEHLFRKHDTVLLPDGNTRVVAFAVGTDEYWAAHEMEQKTVVAATTTTRRSQTVRGATAEALGVGTPA